ncbi:MAG: CoA-binding protein [Deltaproteobacteria bacterium]|nr:MAG: CoA-binding protein [Deltaproteobacteria bacterium]
MAGNPLVEIMNPGSVAIVGASNNIMKMGTVLLTSILRGNYPGKIYPIHPREETVFGLKTYRKAADLPEAPDLAVLVIPTRAVPQVLGELGERGVRKAIIISGGFSEVGEEGGELEKEIVAVARRYGIRFIGPNCIGVINTRGKLNTTFFPYLHEPGGIGIASQSGTYITQVISYLAKYQIRYSQAISVGNSVDIDLVDCLEYLGEDPETKAIALYIEAIRRGREFLEAAREVTRKKPVVALYVGGTEAGARSSLSHTGALSGPDAIYEGALRQSGIIRVETVEELYDWSWALATQPPARGRNIVVLSHSGGPTTSMADACERWGLRVPILRDDLQEKVREFIAPTASPRNPIDLTFSMDLSILADKIPRVLLADPEVDGMVIHGITLPPSLKGMRELAPNRDEVPFQDMEKIVASMLTELIEFPRIFGKPILCSAFWGEKDHAVVFLQSRGIPCFPAPERAVKAMAALCQYGEIREKMHNG